ncbi:hypothetical protein D3C72_1981350 [compost metagenome]
MTALAGAFSSQTVSGFSSHGSPGVKVYLLASVGKSEGPPLKCQVWFVNTWIGKAYFAPSFLISACAPNTIPAARTHTLVAPMALFNNVLIF